MKVSLPFPVISDLKIIQKVFQPDQDRVTLYRFKAPKPTPGVCFYLVKTWGSKCRLVKYYKTYCRTPPDTHPLINYQRGHFVGPKTQAAVLIRVVTGLQQIVTKLLPNRQNMRLPIISYKSVTNSYKIVTKQLQ